MITISTSPVFCDTSFFFAALDPTDVHHPAAQERLQACGRQEVVLATTWEVLSETLTLLRYRRSLREATRFLDQVKPRLRLVPIDDSIREEALLVFRNSSRRLSYCDALSCVVVKVLLDNAACLAFDEDFRHLGLRVI
jgi:predicted nucleic acid-binding protein